MTDMKLTPELKAKLKGFLGFSENPIFCYVPKVYRQKDAKTKAHIIPKEFWPVFKLRGKTGVEVADEEDNAGMFDMTTNKIQLTTGKQRVALLSTNILGWKNFRDEEKEEEIIFKAEGGKVSFSSLQRIPAPLQVELQNAITEQSRLISEEIQGLEF